MTSSQAAEPRPPTTADGGKDLSGSTVYTTLEPCSVRNHPKVPCAVHLAAAGVGRVVIGIYDPNPRIYRDGWRLLRDNSVVLDVFPTALRQRVRSDNSVFCEQFTRRDQDADTSVLFDWIQHPDGFKIRTSDDEFVVRFGTCGSDSVYLLATGAQRVGAPRFAAELSEVPADVEAEENWEGHSRKLAEGEIGILALDCDYLLVKVCRVENRDARAGATHFCVEFDYEYRSAA